MKAYIKQGTMLVDDVEAAEKMISNFHEALGDWLKLAYYDVEEKKVFAIIDAYEAGGTMFREQSVVYLED